MTPHLSTAVCLLITFGAVALPSAARGQAAGQSGAVVKSEFIYEKAPVPSCHASTIVQTKNGLVAAFFAGTDEGEPDVGIWTSRQEPAGDKWSAPVEVVNGVSGDGKRYPCWNPVLFQAPGTDGPLLLFYKVGPTPRQWWGMLVTSADGGKTWSKPARLPDGILGPIKNKPVLLPDGRLLCGSSTEHDGWLIHMEWTTDLGKTWDKTPPLHDKKLELIQPTILTHGGNKLQTLCRSQQGSVAESWSSDAGKTWTPSKLVAGLPNPDAGIDAVTLRYGRHVLVYNPTKRGRTPLSVAVSSDGKTWTPAATLETAPGEYSYPAVIQTDDGKVHVTYTWKRQRIKHAVLDLEKLPK